MEVCQEAKNRTTPLVAQTVKNCHVGVCLGAQAHLTLCDSMDCSRQAPLATGFSSQEHWSGLPCPPPGDLPNPGTEARFPTLQVILYHLSHQGSPRILAWVVYPFFRDLPDPGIELGSPTSQVDSLPAELPGKPFKYIIYIYADFESFYVHRKTEWKVQSFPICP